VHARLVVRGQAQRVPHVEEVAREERGGEGRGVDADALAHGDEVGRGEEAGLARERARGAVGREDRGDVGAGCAFALGAGDVDDVEAGEVTWLGVVRKGDEEGGGRGRYGVADALQGGESVFVVGGAGLHAGGAALLDDFELGLEAV